MPPARCPQPARTNPSHPQKVQQIRTNEPEARPDHLPHQTNPSGPSGVSARSARTNPSHGEKIGRFARTNPRRAASACPAQRTRAAQAGSAHVLHERTRAIRREDRPMCTNEPETRRDHPPRQTNPSGPGGVSARSARTNPSHPERRSADVHERTRGAPQAPAPPNEPERPRRGQRMSCTNEPKPWGEDRPYCANEPEARRKRLPCRTNPGSPRRIDLFVTQSNPGGLTPPKSPARTGRGRRPGSCCTRWCAPSRRSTARSPPPRKARWPLPPAPRTGSR